MHAWPIHGKREHRTLKTITCKPTQAEGSYELMDHNEISVHKLKR